MSQWRRLSRNRRASYVAIAVFVLATAAWASSQWVPSWDEASSVSPVPVAEQPSDLRAPLPAPQEVFVQQRSNSDGLGNAFLVVQLTSQQVTGKQAEGTADFVVIGPPDAQVILRDDGAGGDGTAGDRLYTGIFTIDETELSTRNSDDNAELNSRADKNVPVFSGRTAQGIEQPVPFDFNGFKAGQRVPLDPAAVFIDPESQVTTATLASSKRLIEPKISSAAPVVLGTNQFQERVLMIRNPAVVADASRTYDPCTNGGSPNGVWSFNHLITQMANPAASGIDPAFFTEEWLKFWIANQTINADLVPSRPQMQSIINQWPKQGNGRLDLAQSPLRLLAIAPRLDLRRTTGGGGSYSVNTSGNFLDAGEARFIFGFVLKPGWNGAGFIGAVQIPGAPAGCRALPFTVILEYRVPKCECKDVREWAKKWKELNSFTPGTVAYNSRLEKLTQQFVLANSNPSNPNGSALGQLRTNEVGIDPVNPIQWELREFQLTQFPFTLLQETTVEDTPEDAFNNTATLLNWILTVKPSLNAPRFEDPIPPVPLFFNGGNFLGANAIVPDAPGAVNFHWSAPGINFANLQENWARHRVSRATCNGCHRRETLTHFVHVDPATTIPIPPSPAGSTPALPAEISQFLSGINGLADPANPGGTPARNFDDLARREQDIKRLAKILCGRFHPINMAHVQDSLRTTSKLPANLFEGLTIVPVEQRLAVAVDDIPANHISETH